VRLNLMAGALALALALTACSGASHPAPARTASAAALGTATSAATVSPASHASRPPATDPVPSATPVTGWCGGTGYRLWHAVTKDLTALQAGSKPGSAQLAAAGRRLAADAGAAASYPPPGVSASAYAQGMKELAVSGRDDEQGDTTRATTMAGEADAYLDNIDSYVAVKCP
jgi:hypothetical protein